MSKILAVLVKKLAEGDFGEPPKKLYWKLAGAKTYIGLAFGAAWAVLDYGQSSGFCTAQGLDCSGWATTLGGIAAFLLAAGLFDGALRTSPPNKLAGLVLLLALGLIPLAGCGSLGAQVKLGSDLSHPDERTLRSHVCRGDDSAARMYLALPEYAWIGTGGLERYFTDAKDYEFQGRCPCAGNGCPNGGK